MDIKTIDNFKSYQPYRCNHDASCDCCPIAMFHKKLIRALNHYSLNVHDYISEHAALHAYISIIM